MGGRQRAFSKCPGSLPPLNSLESEFIFSREFTVKKKKKKGQLKNVACCLILQGLSH